jgi:hypothetical protein
MAVFEELSNASEFEEQISNLQGQIDNLDDTYATDTDIQGLQGQIDTLEETVAGLGSGGSSGGASIKTETMTALQLKTFLTTKRKNIVEIEYAPTSDQSASGVVTRIITTKDGTTFEPGLSGTIFRSGEKYYFRVEHIENSNGLEYPYLICDKKYGKYVLRLEPDVNNNIYCTYEQITPSGAQIMILSADSRVTNVSFNVTYIE